ncbi:TFIID-31kDa-domain-containing protein [Periconia macrospinosa]|uniref:TFIID-31kDa-domain-containing protein n=1 Tax=Periconia macrospinosa TaxID=97972 RepID=A0A2V1D4U9_9PLEO|nr:TFIID-31kDa-domain-containing protein [Periconia macrospinosa]
MASPAGEQLTNGISTPPTTGNAGNPSPPTASSTQPNTQQASQTNGTFTSTTTSATAPANPSFPSTSLQDAGTSKRPRDARLIHLILANMGVHAYTERVPLQLLDFSYRYTSGILSDALSYEPPPPHANTSGGGRGKATKNDDDSGGISLNALRTAVAARAASQFTSTLPKEFMSEVASERNRVALPRVEKEWGIRLPPERYCFTGVGYGVREAWEDEEDDDMPDSGSNNNNAGGVGVGGPVGGLPGAADGDTLMRGMDDEDDDEELFEEVMGTGTSSKGDGGASGQDTNMTNG